MESKRSKWTVLVMEQSLRRYQVPASHFEVPMAYNKTVLATGRQEAAEMCIAEIRKLDFDPTIKKVSLFVGKQNVPSEYPMRLHPIQFSL